MHRGAPRGRRTIVVRLVELICHTVKMSYEILRHVPFPYPGGRFPAALGAVVQRTVLQGAEPARVVVHDDEGDWLVSDGINDPNGNSALVYIAHLAEADPSIQELAGMPERKVAWRNHVDEPWTIEDHSYPDEQCDEA